MIRVPTHREPTHPGDMLLEEFLKPMALSQRDLAEGIHVPYQRVNELVNKKRGMTPSTALRLAKFFGTSADFWMNLQLRWDLYQAGISGSGARPGRVGEMSGDGQSEDEDRQPGQGGRDLGRLVDLRRPRRVGSGSLRGSEPVRR